MGATEQNIQLCGYGGDLSVRLTTQQLTIFLLITLIKIRDDDARIVGGHFYTLGSSVYLFIGADWVTNIVGTTLSQHRITTIMLRRASEPRGEAQGP